MSVVSMGIPAKAWVTASHTVFLSLLKYRETSVMFLKLKCLVAHPLRMTVKNTIESGMVMQQNLSIRFGFIKIKILTKIISFYKHFVQLFTVPRLTAVIICDICSNYTAFFETIWHIYSSTFFKRFISVYKHYSYKYNTKNIFLLPLRHSFCYLLKNCDCNVFAQITFYTPSKTWQSNDFNFQNIFG